MFILNIMAEQKVTKIIGITRQAEKRKYFPNNSVGVSKDPNYAKEYVQKCCKGCSKLINYGYYQQANDVLERC